MQSFLNKGVAEKTFFFSLFKFHHKRKAFQIGLQIRHGATNSRGIKIKSVSSHAFVKTIVCQSDYS